MYKRFKNILVFIVGALGYGTIEILFRGYTHWSMILTGGFCLLTLVYVNQVFADLPIELRALAGCITITLYELAAGLVVNLWFDMAVWNYSALPYHYMGQICLLFSVLWYVLCYVLFGAAGLVNSALNFRKSKVR